VRPTRVAHASTSALPHRSRIQHGRGLWEVGIRGDLPKGGTDLAGNDNQPQRVWLNGVHDLTVEEARALAKALNAGCDMLASA